LIGGWEFVANALNAASIVLAGRNNVHTWWTGIAGCAAFAYVFLGTQLYADMTLQFFFIGSSVLGWWHWVHGRRADPLPVRHASRRLLAAMVPVALLGAAGYAWMLIRYTDAYAPVADSLVLAFSVAGQLLLVGRRVETWWCWLVVNTIAVPLFASRGLYLTAVLYAFFWANAVVSLRHWRRLAAS